MKLAQSEVARRSSVLVSSHLQPGELDDAQGPAQAHTEAVTTLAIAYHNLGAELEHTGRQRDSLKVAAELPPQPHAPRRCPLLTRARMHARMREWMYVRLPVG